MARFSVKDLRTGMFGVMDNGWKFVIVDNIVVYENGNWDNLLYMNDNFEWHYKKINKLFIDCNCFDSLTERLNGDRPQTCVYNRNACVEMTIPEIEKALGITNLKIKK